MCRLDKKRAELDKEFSPVNSTAEDAVRAATAHTDIVDSVAQAESAGQDAWQAAEIATDQINGQEKKAKVE